MLDTHGSLDGCGCPGTGIIRPKFWAMLGDTYCDAYHEPPPHVPLVGMHPFPGQAGGARATFSQRQLNP